MKYLISYNESSSYYTVISEDEFRSFSDYRNDIDRFIDIDDTSVNRIESVLGKGLTSLKVSNTNMLFYLMIYTGKGGYAKKQQDIDMYVYKMEDDWFIIKEKSPELGNSKYYKCDQIDGVIKLLKDHKLTN